MAKIKIGTTIIYRPAWGAEPPTKAIVEDIEKSKVKGEKYGDPVDEIDWEEREYGVFGLDNHHWCYGYQIDKIVSRHKVILVHTTQRESLENGWIPKKLVIYLNDDELEFLKECMSIIDSGTLALHRFTSNPPCSKHHKYLIRNTFEAGEIKISIVE